jgi:hypothetical protein
MDWIVVLLFVISAELMWIGTRLGNPQDTGLEKVCGELKEIREELQWFKKDNFADHLFKKLEDAAKELGKELHWFEGGTFANHLLEKLDQIDKGVGDWGAEIQKISEELDWSREESCSAEVLRQLGEICSSLDQINDSVRKV